MNLTTLRFGAVEVEEDKIITFGQGVPGFEDKHRFVFLTPDEGVPFSFMQSVDDGDLSFIVADPFLFVPDYDFELPPSVVKELHIEAEGDVMVFSIMSVSQTSEVSLNLIAPVVINTVKKCGKQLILHQSPYKTKHRIEMPERGDAKDPEPHVKEGTSSC